MAVQVHGRLLQARLLLEINAASTTACELAELIQQTAAALVACRQLMQADGRIPAVIRTEYLCTAAALVNLLVKPAPPYAAPMDEADAVDMARCLPLPLHACMYGTSLRTERISFLCIFCSPMIPVSLVLLRNVGHSFIFECPHLHPRQMSGVFRGSTLMQYFWHDKLVDVIKVSFENLGCNAGC